jgi:hypothetical protein
LRPAVLLQNPFSSGWRENRAAGSGDKIGEAGETMLRPAAPIEKAARYGRTRTISRNDL